MKRGTLYGIGVGPGDPGLITVKGAFLLRQCRHIFVPKARTASESLALAVAESYITAGSKIHELLFPMTPDQAELTLRWGESAEKVATVLETGDDVCFLTIGDPLLYSTYIYLLRELRARIPDVRIITIPGITAFSAAAALAGFPVGEAKETVTIVPASGDLETVKQALDGGGTVVLMKIGRHLPEILKLLDDAGLIEAGVFVSHAGMENERVEEDLRKLRGEADEVGYLSILLVHAGKGKN